MDDSPEDRNARQKHLQIGAINVLVDYAGKYAGNHPSHVESMFLFDHDDVKLWRLKLSCMGVVPDGFTDLQMIAAMTDKIEAAMGVKPDGSDAKNIEASHAWVLLHFAITDGFLRALKNGRDENGEPTANDPAFRDLIEQHTIRLGCIMEMWRWRSTGLDGMAFDTSTSRQALASGKGGKRVAYNAEKTAEKETLYEGIRSAAAAIDKSYGSPRPKLAKRFGVSLSTVDRALKSR